MSRSVLMLAAAGLLAVAASRPVPASDGVVLPESVLEYLRVLKFIAGRPAVGSSLEDLEQPLRRAQAEVGLPETGKLDAATLEMFGRPRCGVSPGWLGGASPRRRRFSTLGSRWSIPVVTYRVLQYSSTLSVAEVDAALSGALAEISAATRLRFARALSNDTESQVDVSFVDERHGCLSDFSGTVLAHAYAPLDGGDLHVRESNDWQEHDVVYIVAHELLHSLGVGHSMKSSALMFPTYRRVLPGVPLLSPDDVDVLQLLYGKP